MEAGKRSESVSLKSFAIGCLVASTAALGIHQYGNLPPTMHSSMSHLERLSEFQSYTRGWEGWRDEGFVHPSATDSLHNAKDVCVDGSTRAYSLEQQEVADLLVRCGWADRIEYVPMREGKPLYINDN